MRGAAISISVYKGFLRAFSQRGGIYSPALCGLIKSSLGDCRDNEKILWKHF